MQATMEVLNRNIPNYVVKRETGPYNLQSFADSLTEIDWSFVGIRLNIEYNLQSFADSLTEIDWSFVGIRLNIESAFARFTNTFLCYYNLHCLKTTQRCGNKGFKLWITDDIRESSKKLKNYYAVYRDNTTMKDTYRAMKKVRNLKTTMLFIEITQL
ncbi:hypothetical protein QE152_g27275 [Popillia japonica]|uniref:Uncharacterized protein n=1 Tax=Popillia japonica TaxID=7064 RepID=A0AAW1JW39_POPJA